MAQQPNDPNSNDGKSPEIYVAYSESIEDQEFGSEIRDKIEKRGIDCYDRSRDDLTGQVFKNLHEKSWNCRLVLLIYTKHCLKDKIIKMLQILSLKYTIEKEKLTLMLLLHDIDKKNLPKEMHFVPHVYTKDENCFEKLMDKLKAPDISMDHVLPVGNIAFGLVWSYYYGYLNLILPKLSKRIDEWIESKSPKAEKKFPRRLYLILPTHAKCYSSLTEQDESIEFDSHLPTLEIPRAGTANRKYKNTIYKICKNGKEYYCVAEYPNPLKTMTKIKNGNLAGFTESDFSNQIYLFKEKLSDILNHKDCPHNRCTLVILDEEKERSLSDVLIEAIENDLENQDPRDISEMDHSHNKEDIYVAYCAENLDFVKNLVEQIEETKELKCFYDDRDGGCGQDPENRCIESQDRRVLFIYSEGFLNDGLINYHLYHTLQGTAESKELSFMFLIHDIDKKRFPLDFVHHIFTSETNYFEKLMEKLRAPYVSVDQLLPIGNISSGLSWGFYYGYLKIIMPKLPRKIDDWMKKNPSKKIPRRIYILLPTDAHCYSTLDKVDDCMELDDEKLPPELRNQSGVTSREYKNNIYKISKPDQEYYCVCEYATPLTTMFEMEKGQIAGLAKSALMTEVVKFQEKLSTILKHEDCADNCCTLVICDDKQPVSDILVPAIKKDLGEI